MNSIRSWIAAVGIAALSQATLAAPVALSGSLSAGDPVYNRVLAGNPPSGLSIVGTSVSYDAYAFHVTANSSYLLQILSAAFTTGVSDDTFITLYQTAFDAASPLTNALRADDDSGLGSLSSMTLALNAGVNYFLVVTSFDNGQFGDYTGQLSNASGGGGDVVLDSVTTDVPEPSMLMLVPMALSGLALTRRRRRQA